MPLALRTRGLSRRMGRHFAVRDVSLSVPAGAVYGLLGPNGAGKTTTLRLLLDLVHPDAGEVEILGVDARRRRRNPCRGARRGTPQPGSGALRPMPDLTISLTLTPALVATAVVYDVVLVALGVALIRRLRQHRADAPAGRPAARLSLR